ncbi:hypothetical protein DXN04_26555 [Chitinophaga silvisoli]|uniref:Signal transduction histidine kinase internal region domain-containing protein n=2 Tax=Chitinophaga silvisoli TaxID=2291814 RepID=A0A3E1NUV3_9BACT|nr:hypothetical protein DXN04_26555 [Chitinophaga silvisoli]
MNIDKLIALITKRRLLFHLSFWWLYGLSRLLLLHLSIPDLSLTYAILNILYVLLLNIFFYYYLAYLTTPFFRKGRYIIGVLLLLATFPLWVILSMTFSDISLMWDHSFYPEIRKIFLWHTFEEFVNAWYLFGGVLWGVLPPIMIKLLLETYRHIQRQRSILSYNNQMAKKQAYSNLAPEFIFGTLQLIQDKLKNNQNAQQATTQLTNLLDFAFYKSQKKTVTTQEEIDFLESYIGFERMRHSPNRVSIHFEHSVSENYTIPPLLFINFIENAFKHGVNSTIQQSWVKIYFHENNGILSFKVQNSLPKNTTKSSGGIGLKNVRRRLELEFPGKFVLNSMKSDIFEIDLEIQLR